MKEMLIILFTAILVENYVLMKFLAICSFLGQEGADTGHRALNGFSIGS